MNYNYPGLTIVIDNQPPGYKLPSGVQLLEVPNIHPADLLKWVESICIVINSNSKVKYVVFTYNPYVVNYLNNLVIENYKLIPSKKAIKHLVTRNYKAFINKNKIEVYDTKYNKSGFHPGGFHWESLSDVSVDIQMQYFNIIETND